MKRLIFLFVIAAFALCASGQDVYFFKKDIQKTYTGVAGDTLNSSYILTKSIAVNKDYPYRVNVQIEADSLGDGGDITCALRGSWDNSTFYTIGSAVTWYVTASDTTFSLNSFTSTFTEVVAAYNITSDTTGYQGLVYPQTDTVKVAATTKTVTLTADGLIYPYLQVYFLGADGNADMELEKLTIRILPD